jgi:hypothetical protein
MFRGVCSSILIFALWLASARSARSAPFERPLSPFTPRFGNGCQTLIICASIERLGLYAGATIQGALTDTADGRETALGGTLSLGFDFVRHVAIEAHFATAAIHNQGEPLLVAAGPLTIGARLRLGPHAPTLFSEKPQPRWALVLGTQLGFRLPRAEGDPRHLGAMALYVPQPSAHAGLEVNWGPAQLTPSIAILGAERAAYLQLGLRASLRLAPSMSVDVEALSWMPASVPDEPGRCSGGTRAGIGIRGLLTQGILGIAQYSVGRGCEPTHSITLGATFAFGEYPLRKIPTAEEVGVQRLWLGMVDPVLDCNGWMLDDQSLMPLFKYGDPVPGTNLIVRNGETFQVGDHFDIDRSGLLYRPNQYVALAGEHRFTQASVKDKLTLPVCEAGPRHRFFEYCKNLHRSIDTIANLVRSDGNAGWPAVWAQQLEFERECLAQDEQDDPKKLIERIATALSTRGMRPAMGFTTAPPPSPPPGGRPGPGSSGNAPRPGDVAEHTTPPGHSSANSQRPPKDHVSPQIRAREQAIADYLESQGRTTVYNPDQGVAGKGRQFDYWVDGMPTEFKSPMPGLNSKIIKGIVNDSIRGPAQARNVIIDARGTGCPQEEAIRGIRRAMGISRGKVDRIEVIGDGYHVTN